MLTVLAGKGGLSIVAHIGNEEGFATNSLLLFQSKLKGSYLIKRMVRNFGNISVRKF
jgi:hypothetical protein